MDESEPRGSLARQRSTGSAHGERRRRALLAAVTDELERTGLVDFTLRRAARAANTTHKVLIYHFGNADELLRQCLGEIRQRRVQTSAAMAQVPPDSTLAERVRLVWEALLAEQSPYRVLDQATGLALYDPERYRQLARDATDLYLPALEATCPPGWEPSRRTAVAHFVLATLRGLLVEHLTSQEPDSVSGGLHVLMRALDREEGMR